jgi:hypothetical protein
MNCRQCEQLMMNAVDRLIDPFMREDFVSHVEGCVSCGGRFAEERSLNGRLYDLRGDDATLKAPKRVENLLLEGFRARATEVDLRVARLGAGTGRRRLTAATAIAASLMVLIGLSMFRRQGRAPEGKQAQAETAPKLGFESAPTSIGLLPGTEPVQYVRHRVRHPGQRSSQTAVPATDQGLAASLKPADKSLHDRVAEGSAQTEIATDFLPLVSGGDSMPMESGRLVRVELPRSALLSMGLPMNIERAGEPVKADVLLGEDGVAKAIRFIH